MLYLGSIACKAILNNKNRIINCLYIDSTKKDRNTKYIISLASKKNIKIKYITKDIIYKLTNSKTTGGIFIDALPINYPNTIKNITNIKDNIIFFIQGVEDPFNLGYTLRTLYAFGFNTIMINHYHFNDNDHIIVKSSAGASEYMNIILSDNINDDIKYLNSLNYHMLLMNRSNNSIDYTKYDYSNKKLVIAIGGEKRGLSKILYNLSKEQLYIPYYNDFKNALSVSSSVICIASEIKRQLNK